MEKWKNGKMEKWKTSGGVQKVDKLYTRGDLTFVTERAQCVCQIADSEAAWHPCPPTIYKIVT